MSRFFRLIRMGGAVVAALTTAAQAQWSIGQPGTREPPQGQNRYVYLVMSDPLPGREFDFNDGYQNTHMGDLVQLPGWNGAQRFRWVPNVVPRNIQSLYRRGNLIIWDQEGTDLDKLRSDANAAITGGKSRLIPGFDYAPDGAVRATYQVAGARITRPDGRKPFIPDYADNKTSRPNRYIMLEFMEPVGDISDNAFEAALAKRVDEVLALPGWMAAQPFRYTTPPPSARPTSLAFTKYLMIWETEGGHAQELQDALIAATKAGKVKAPAADPATAQSSWWVTTSPTSPRTISSDKVGGALSRSVKNSAEVHDTGKVRVIAVYIDVARPQKAASYCHCCTRGAAAVMMKQFGNDSDGPGTTVQAEQPQGVFWIDLLNPTKDEVAFAESRANIRVPSVDSLSEIESSSRLSVDHDVIYLSIPTVAQGDTVEAYLSPTGFILTRCTLVTVRFAPLSVFDSVAERVKQDVKLHSAREVFLTLLDAIVDRAADVLERLGAELAKVSKSVFRGDPSRPRHIARSNNALRRALLAVGTTGDRLALTRDAMLGLSRVSPFVLGLRKEWIAHEFEARLEAAAKDLASLNDYETHLSDKVQFLLDAILGFITIQQNELFKILTIVSVVAIPPTLVTGIYGMNFKYMPELNWIAGYPFGLAMIALSALVPLAWFKWRAWF